MIERWGHRLVFWILSVISVIGIISEYTQGGVSDPSSRDDRSW